MDGTGEGSRIKKLKRVTRKRILIIAVWLACAAIAAVTVYQTEYRLQEETARENLVTQAMSISLLMPEVEQTQQCHYEESFFYILDALSDYSVVSEHLPQYATASAWNCSLSGPPACAKPV